MRREFGSLRPGSVADLLQFRLREGSFTFTDTHQSPRKGNRLIEPLLTVRKGIAYQPGSVPVSLRQIYPCDRPIFDAARDNERLDRSAPQQPVQKPALISFHDIAYVRGFGDAVVFARVDHIFHFHMIVLQSAIDFAVMIDIQQTHLKQTGRPNFFQLRSW